MKDIILNNYVQHPVKVDGGLNPTQNLVDAYEMQSNGLRPIIGYDGTVPIITQNPNMLKKDSLRRHIPKGIILLVHVICM